MSNILYQKVITLEDIDDIPKGSIAYCLRDDEVISFSFPDYGWLVLDLSYRDKFRAV